MPRSSLALRKLSTLNRGHCQLPLPKCVLPGIRTAGTAEKGRSGSGECHVTSEDEPVCRLNTPYKPQPSFAHQSECRPKLDVVRATITRDGSALSLKTGAPGSTNGQ